MTKEATKSKKPEKYVATGAAARRLRQWVSETESVPEGDEVFYIAQSLSFLIHDSSVSALSKALLTPRNRFAVRKLATALDLLLNVFMGG